MKENIIVKLKQTAKEAVALAVLMFALTVLLVYFYDLTGVDFNKPFYYFGGDEMSIYQTCRMIEDTGWNTGTDRIAAMDEYFNNTTDMIAGFHNSDVLIAKVMMFVTGNNVALSANLTFLSMFYMIALVTYIACRLLKLSHWISAGAGLVYSTLAFAFIRGLTHLQLTAYFFVPLAFVMAIWIYEDEKFMLLGKGFFRYKRNIGGLVMAALISSAGIGYWQIFSCFIMLVSLLAKYLRTKDKKVFNRGWTSIFSVVLFLLIGIIPEIITILTGKFNMAGRVRSLADSEMYSLKLIQLILPVDGHGIESLQSLIDNYNEYVPLVNENWSAYIGLLGVAGLIFLFVWMFVGRKDETPLRKRLSLLADINICCFSLATIGGIGAILFVAGFEILRGYNRISVYIAFASILAMCMLIDEGVLKLKNIYLKCVAIAVTCLMMIFVAWEQNPRIGFDYEGSAARWDNDAEFYARVDEVMEQDDMILQLPYASCPEGDVQNDMNHMEHITGYIHSRKLRWSYGVLYESENDLRWQQLVEQDAADMIDDAKQKGFKGIYINRNAYETEDWKALETDIQEVLGVQPLVSGDGMLSFYKIGA